MDFHALLTQINAIVWGPATLLLLVGTGIYLSFRLGFIQLLRLPLALQLLFKPANGKGELSSFAALCTALSATIGTGNIVGVATAIKLGGPGACSGCGLPPCLAWPPSMPSVYWRLSFAPLTATVTSPVAPCTT